ncbi:hypothetical protein RR21198_3244 [Rhodococcus rhodochrous ATCC 21198]|nr:hypothetical protein RR21198_3244 [Rhodococcus rhodochrous ATCC 21198]
MIGVDEPTEAINGRLEAWRRHALWLRNFLHLNSDF